MINNNTFSWELYQKAPVVGIIRGMSRGIIWQIATTYRDAGFFTLEITMNTDAAVEIISALRSDFPDLNIGAGTVCTLKDFDKAIGAGAQFVVMPIIDEAVIKAALAAKVPVFPGAYTPTEIYKAWSLGASAVKVFPASQWGVKYIQDVLAPLNQIKLLPTGGVSLTNIKSFFQAGVAGVGMGSSLFDKQFIQAGDFDGLKAHFLKIKAEIQGF